MACGKCPNDGDQMEESSVYGVKVCQCPTCGYRNKGAGPKANESGLSYDKSPKEGEGGGK